MLATLALLAATSVTPRDRLLSLDTHFGSERSPFAALGLAAEFTPTRIPRDLAYGLGMQMTGRWECSRPACGETPARIAPFLALSFGYVLPLYW